MGADSIYQKAVWESDPEFENEYNEPTIRPVVPWTDDEFFKDVSTDPNDGKDYDEDYI